MTLAVAEISVLDSDFHTRLVGGRGGMNYATMKPSHRFTKLLESDEPVICDGVEFVNVVNIVHLNTKHLKLFGLP
jgi:hypothetical protein